MHSYVNTEISLRNWVWRRFAGLRCGTKQEEGEFLPRKMELKLSEILVTAEGGRSEMP